MNFEAFDLIWAHFDVIYAHFTVFGRILILFGRISDDYDIFNNCVSEIIIVL